MWQAGHMRTADCRLVCILGRQGQSLGIEPIPGLNCARERGGYHSGTNALEQANAMLTDIKGDMLGIRLEI